MAPFDPSCIDVEDFLDCLDIKNVSRATEREWKFSCPYPDHLKGDESPSGYMNTETSAFFCHSCHKRGNAISFTADILRVSPIEAIRMLKQRYSPGGIDPDSRCMVEEIKAILHKPKPEPRVNVAISDDILEPYYVNWQAEHDLRYTHHASPWAVYMFERGFTVESLISWQFGYSRTHDRITLPVRNHDGHLVGIKSRSWNYRKPKYLNKVDDLNPFLKNEVIFGLNRCINADLILVEGEFNVVAMHQHGFQNTAGINGSYFGATQIKLLKQFANSVTLFFDSDSAGIDATAAVAEALSPFMEVYICPEHHGDPADMHTRSIADVVADRVSYRRVLIGA